MYLKRRGDKSVDEDRALQNRAISPRDGGRQELIHVKRLFRLLGSQCVGAEPPSWRRFFRFLAGRTVCRNSSRVVQSGAPEAKHLVPFSAAWRLPHTNHFKK